jgi:ribonuclease E
VVEHTAPAIDETPRSVEEVVEHHPKALEAEHEPKPLV